MAHDAGREAAIVFGASRGLGKAIAAALVDAGFAVAAVCRKPGDAERIEAELGGRGPAAGLLADVTDASAVEAAVAAARQRFGRLDAVVNNAGIIEPIALTHQCDPAEWAGNVAINLVGPFHAIRAGLPVLLEKGRGTVVNISSGAAADPLEGWSAYCAAKAGLAMLTRAVDHEYRGRGIAAYGFRPGLTDTDMQAAIRASGVNPVSRVERSDLTPPELPASGVAWLVRERPADLMGREVSFGDPAFRRRAGLV
jgi:3-oxoacyl-[acyl-carrier protein] reductase